jgi:tetratricopeptide (TPR) repeat protein
MRALPCRVHRVRRCAAALVAAVLACTALGQGLPEAAAEALRHGQRQVARALATYETHVPDLPLWETALGAGDEAVRLAPDHPAPRRFLAQAYRELGWYARSWSNWQAYLDRGGTVDGAVERQLLEVAEWMGVIAFDAGRRDESVAYLETVLRFDSGHLAANARLARYRLDRGELDAALPYLEAVGDRLPALASELQRARRVERYGPAAAAAYHEGLDRRDADAPEAALESFLEAGRLAPAFTEAWRRAAITADLLGRAGPARNAYLQVLDAAPGDAEALAGLGRLAMAEGDLVAALGWFERAVAAAPDASAFQEERAEAQRRLDQRAAAEAEEARQAAEEAERRAAEQEAARRAEARAEAVRRDRPEAEVQALAARESLVLLDAPVRHRRGAPGPTPAVAFIDAAWLDTDLGDRAGDVLHLRLDVRDKPSDAPVRYQLCLVPSDVTVVPACTDPTLLAFSSPGAYEARTAWTDLSGFDAVDWGEGIESVMLVLRRGDGAAVDAPLDGGAGDDADGDAGAVDLDAYLPMSVRVRAMAVRPGAPFPGWP